MRRLALSHSRMEAHQECPLRFKVIYLDKRDPGKTLPMLCGSLLHKFFELYVMHLGKVAQQTDHAAAAAIFDDLWRAREANKDLVGIPESLYGGVRATAEAFWTNRVITPSRVIETEMRIALTEKWELTDWYDKETAFFRIIADRVDAGAEPDVVHVTDYKTGFAAVTQGEAEANPQLRRYVVGLRVAFPSAKSFVMDLDFVRPNIVRTVTLAPETADETIDRIMAVSDRIEEQRRTGDWPATPGRGCASCPLFDDATCPAMAKAALQRPPKTAEEASELLGKVLLAEEQVGRWKSLLRAYGDVLGPARSGGKEYGASVVEAGTYQAREIIEWAAKWGVDLNLATVSKTTVEVLVRQLPKAAREEATVELPAMTVSRRTEYRIKNASAEELG